ncbi:MAG TPA: two-component regulator propeller domain-containing protein [Bacteroidales bacterium]|nr:two-component regulator propeller domain-containing protein [Bacteroidales bacterium]
MNRILKVWSAALLLSASAFAGNSIGSWRTHFSYKTANQVALADDKVYVEASGKIFSYQISNENIQTYTTLDGLNGHTVKFIGWSSDQKTLVVVYSDGNIDFLTEKGLINLPDFKNKSITGDKTIYGMRVVGKEAFLFTGVGLIVLDVAKREFAENYYLGFNATYTPCTDAGIWGDSLMVATSAGLYSGSRLENLQDVSFWKKEEFVAGTKAKKIVRFGNQFFALAQNGILYKGRPGNWLAFVSDANISEISVQDSALFACSGTTTYMYDKGLNRISVESVINRSIAWDSENHQLYVASGSSGLSILKYQNGSYVFEKDPVFPDGPVQNTAWNAFFKDGVYYSTAGARWGNRYFYDGDVMIFEDDQWRGLSDKQAMIDSMGYRPLDFLNMAIDPTRKDHYFITSWGDGMMEFRNNKFYKHHGQENSPLKNTIPGRFCRVDGATFDKQGNLWVLNSKYYIDPSKSTMPDSSLCILKPDGTWLQPFFSKMMTAPTWNSILFASNGQVWMNSVRVRPEIFILDKNEMPIDPTRVSSIGFENFTDQDGNLLTPYNINCLTEDKNGTIWIGTSVGPILATGISRIFSDRDYTFTRIKIPRNDGTDNADYLLNDILINCITVDGANRKWIGTNGNGVYLLSSDGLKAVHHFTMQNSPLPSDYIWSVAINPETGEVFIGTDAGLVSYRSDATEGKMDFQNIHVFPNPVKPEYNGQITVTGLMEKTQVRITDLKGNAVISGNSLGGQFSWNGFLKNGKKASSGVYLVFCASEDGTESEACKFMIVR